MSSGQASLFQSLISLARPEDGLIPSNPTYPFPSPHGSVWSSIQTLQSGEVDVESNTGGENEDDPEGVIRVLSVNPVPDCNAQSNTLAFVLQSCEYIR
jgi:hypothetical protein